MMQSSRLVLAALLLLPSLLNRHFRSARNQDLIDVDELERVRLAKRPILR